MLRLILTFVIVHAIAGAAFAGQWLWIRMGVVLVVWLLGLNVRADDAGRQ